MDLLSTFGMNTGANSLVTTAPKTTEIRTQDLNVPKVEPPPPPFRAYSCPRRQETLEFYLEYDFVYRI